MTQSEKVLQTDESMPPVIQRYGCNFRACLGIAETYTRKLLTPEQILYAAVMAFSADYKQERVMAPDCTVRWPAHIINWGLDLLGFGSLLRAYQIGSQEGQDQRWWSIGNHDHTITATILKGKTVNGNLHFREGDAYGKLKWDPSPDVKIAHEIMQIFYRIKEIGG